MSTAVRRSPKKLCGDLTPYLTLCLIALKFPDLYAAVPKIIKYTSRGRNLSDKYCTFRLVYCPSAHLSSRNDWRLSPSFPSLLSSASFCNGHSHPPFLSALSDYTEYDKIESLSLLTHRVLYEVYSVFQRLHKCVLLRVRPLLN